MAVALVWCVLGTVCELSTAVLEACMQFAATESYSIQQPHERRLSERNGGQVRRVHK